MVRDHVVTATKLRLQGRGASPRGPRQPSPSAPAPLSMADACDQGRLSDGAVLTGHSTVPTRSGPHASPRADFATAPGCRSVVRQVGHFDPSRKLRGSPDSIRREHAVTVLTEQVARPVARVPPREGRLVPLRAGEGPGSTSTRILLTPGPLRHPPCCFTPAAGRSTARSTAAALVDEARAWSVAALADGSIPDAVAASPRGKARGCRHRAASVERSSRRSPGSGTGCDAHGGSRASI